MENVKMKLKMPTVYLPHHFLKKKTSLKTNVMKNLDADKNYERKIEIY